MQKSRRFLPVKKGSNSAAKLSHEQVRKAVLAFQNRGGLIHTLPPEPEGKRSMIGRRWVAMYETIFEHA